MCRGWCTLSSRSVEYSQSDKRLQLTSTFIPRVFARIILRTTKASMIYRFFAGYIRNARTKLLHVMVITIRIMAKPAEGEIRKDFCFVCC